MNILNSITRFLQRHVLTVPTFGHLVMIACAIASYENIHDFFKALHGSEVVAIGLGVAIGAALVMAAGLLAGMGNDWRNPRLQLIATVTTLLALLSGGVQGASYASHGLHWLWAGLIGLALPVVGELGIALAVSAYEQEQRAKRLAAADDQVEEKINAAVDLALSDIDMSSTKKDIEAAARKIVKNKLDTLLARRIGAPMPPTGNDESAESKQIAEVDRPSIAEMNAERQAIIAERRSNIMHLFSTYGEMSLAELQSRLQDDVGVTVAERTLRTDLQALVDAGDLVKMGRGRWAAALTIATTLPATSVIVTNGHHAAEV
jgi:hypothetical protein